jgi:exopolysaccharide production protein ExoQ
MDPSLALLVCIVGTAGLFFLDRDPSVRNSKALWLPVIWLCILGSRPLSEWGGGRANRTASQLLEGSPLDRLVFGVLLAAGIIVLLRRSSRTSPLLRANWLILIYFAYCLLSVFWSDFPDVAFKRWTKSLGDLVMVLIVVTEAEPVAAIRRLLSRTGFILLPASVLLIKYFGDLGREYNPWAETPMNTGVTTNKNSLGVITLVLSLGALWRVHTLLRAKGEPNRGRRLLAQGTLLAFGVALLVLAHSATSAASFAFGAALMITTALPVIRRSPAGVHALVLVIVLAGGLTIIFGGGADVARAMGRNEDLTGRTDIWAAVIPMVPDAAVGAGFETFWLGSRLERVWRAFDNDAINEAHNGYIEVYLNLGWVGVSLIALILINGYSCACAAFRRDPAVGGLMVAYVATAAIYSGTEAGYRMLHPIWVFFLLAVLGARVIASGAFGRAPQPLAAPADRAAGLLASDALALGPLRGNN